MGMIPIAHNSRSKLKACTACGVEKPESFHYFYRKFKDGRTREFKDICKDCTAIGGKGRNRSKLEDVLNKYVEDPETGCWNYTGTTAHGYGIFYHQSSSLKAHRVAYQVLVGPIAHGLVLDHLCQNKICINPDHLEQVRQGENTRRWYVNYKHCSTCTCEEK